MRIATYNINGIGARLPNLLRWLDERAPDVACLQELKAPQEKFPEKEIRDAGYGVIWHGQKSWNGVAILARGTDPKEMRRVLPGDPGGRAQPLHRGHGPRGHDRLPVPAERQPGPGPEVRLQAALARPLHRSCRDPGGTRRAGDPRRRLQRHPHRARRLQARALGGRCAVPHRGARGVRAPHGPGLDRCASAPCYPNETIYTFWDFFRNAYERNAGLRIDHLLLNPNVRDRLTDAGVDRDVRGWERPSDHAPTWVDIRD